MFLVDLFRIYNSWFIVGRYIQGNIAPSIEPRTQTHTEADTQTNKDTKPHTYNLGYKHTCRHFNTSRHTRQHLSVLNKWKMPLNGTERSHYWPSKWVLVSIRCLSIWEIKHSAPCLASLFYYITTTAAVQEQLYHLNTTAILGVYYLNATAILELLY